MRHRVDGRQLSRTTPHRIAMRRNMAVSLLQHGAIRTTAEKAKEVRGFVEKLITQAKRGTLHARRLVIAELGHDREIHKDDGEPTGQTIVQKLFDEIAPKYADRAGGYTRIIRLAEFRVGDGGSQVVLQLVGETAETDEGRRPGRRRRLASKRHQYAAAALHRKRTVTTQVVEGPAADALADAQAQDLPEESTPATEGGDQPAEADEDKQD